jgi:hypothetical protein
MATSPVADAGAPQGRHDFPAATLPNLPVEIVSPAVEVVPPALQKIDVTTTLTSTIVISVLANPTTVPAAPVTDKAREVLRSNQAEMPGAFILIPETEERL